MKTITRLIEKYDTATVFIGVATVVVLVELSLMRLLVPSSASATGHDPGVLMKQVYAEASVEETKNKLAQWKLESMKIIDASNAEAAAWQKELKSMHVFSIEREEMIQKNAGNEKDMQITAANYAVGQLYLQSIMTGRTPLANINGTIYQTGDSIPIRGGEIVMLVTEVGSDYAKVQLADCKDIERTIYISRDIHVANGERLP